MEDTRPDQMCMVFSGGTKKYKKTTPLYKKRTVFMAFYAFSGHFSNILTTFSHPPAHLVFF